MENLKKVLMNNDGLLYRIKYVLEYYANESNYESKQNIIPILHEDKGNFAKNLLNDINSIYEEYNIKDEFESNLNDYYNDNINEQNLESLKDLIKKYSNEE